MGKMHPVVTLLRSSWLVHTHIEITASLFMHYEKRNVKSPSFTQKSVSQENGFKKSKNPSSFFATL